MQANTFHDPSSPTTPSQCSSLSNIEVPEFQTRDPMLKGTNWTDFHTALVGLATRQATGSCRRCRPLFADLLGRHPGLTVNPEVLIQPIWGSNRAFRVDRPIQKLTKFQPAIVLDQKFTPAHFQPIEDTP